MLSSISLLGSNFRSSTFPEGSPIIPVLPPIRAIGVWPYFWNLISPIIAIKFPTCKLGAVGSNPL